MTKAFTYTCIAMSIASLVDASDCGSYTKKQYCDNERDCYVSGSHLCAVNLYCRNSHTCDNANDGFKTAASKIYMLATSTNKQLDLSLDKETEAIYGYGDSSMRLATTRVAEKNYILGANSFADGEFNTIGLPKVYLEVNGLYSFDGTTFTCNGGSECTVECANCKKVKSSPEIIVEPGATLHLNCPRADSCDKLIVNFKGAGLSLSGEGISKIDFQWNFNDVERRLSDNTPRLRKPSEKPYENRKERALQIKSCRGTKSCKGDTISSDVTQLHCGGLESCRYAVLTSHVASLIELNGPQSGEQSELKGQYITAKGYESLNKAYVESSSSVSLDGYKSGSNLVVRQIQGKTLTVAANTKYAFQKGLMICLPGADCLLYCNTYLSCLDTTLDCSAMDSSLCGTTCNGCTDEELDALVTLPKCQNLDNTACSKSLYCTLSDDTCKARINLCSATEKAECLSKSNNGMCSWSKNSCSLKSSKTPSLYKKYNRVM